MASASWTSQALGGDRGDLEIDRQRAGAEARQVRLLLPAQPLLDRVGIDVERGARSAAVRGRRWGSTWVTRLPRVSGSAGRVAPAASRPGSPADSPAYRHLLETALNRARFVTAWGSRCGGRSSAQRPRGVAAPDRARAPAETPSGRNCERQTGAGSGFSPRQAGWPGLQCAPASLVRRLVRVNARPRRATQGGSDPMSLQAELAAPSCAGWRRYRLPLPSQTDRRCHRRVIPPGPTFQKRAGTTSPGSSRMPSATPPIWRASSSSPKTSAAPPIHSVVSSASR